MSTHASSRYIKVGCLGKTFGIKGWMRLYSDTAPLEQLFNYKPLLLQHRGDYLPLEIEGYRPHANQFIIRLLQCSTPEEAQLYVGDKIFILDEQLPKTNTEKAEYYCKDLEGLQVINQAGINLGMVDYIFPTGANDVLVLKGDRERLVPYIKDVILSIDLQKKIVTVDWDADF